MSHAVMQSKRYANGHKGHMRLHILTHTHAHTQSDSKSIFWQNSKTEVDLIHCGNDRVKLYTRHRIEFWCWDFSALTALSVSLSPSSPLTSLHPLPRHMPKTTTINMIGPSHKRRRAIMWTGMTRGKWNWFQVFPSAWIYVYAPQNVHACVC